MELELIKISLIIFYKFIYFYCNNFYRKYIVMQNVIERINLIKEISNLLLDYNVVYIKFFQSLCLDQNLISHDESEYLLKFTDQVPYKDNEIHINYLHCVCEKYNIQLKSEKPISSGIIALAYKGTIERNGNSENVIIKLKKIGIEDRYEDAFKNLLFFSKLLNYLPIIHNFNIEKILKDTQENILIQTDFKNEVKNLLDYKEKSINYPEYISPEPIEEITNEFENCIVMEDITGMTIKDVIKLDDNDKEKFGRLLVKHGLLCVLYFGIANCDFHAGNAFFYKDVSDKISYQVGIIDFGICTRCCRDNMRGYYIFFYNILSKKEYSKIKEIIHIFIDNKENYFNLPEKDKTLLLDEFNEHLRIMNKNNEQLDPMFFFKISKTLKKFNIYFSKEFNQIITTMNACNSLGKTLTHNLNEVIFDICKEFEKLENILKID